MFPCGKEWSTGRSSGTATPRGSSSSDDLEFAFAESLYVTALLEVVRDEDSFSGQNVVDSDVSAGINCIHTFERKLV